MINGECVKNNCGISFCIFSMQNMMEFENNVQMVKDLKNGINDDEIKDILDYESTIYFSIYFLTLNILLSCDFVYEIKILYIRGYFDLFAI